MDWNEDTARYHELTFAHDCQLSSLPKQWQRELAALWRLEADVTNGGYLQFLTNWGRETYEYAARGLERMSALKMARIVDDCQALVEEHYDSADKTQEQRAELMPNECLDREGHVIKDAGSILPEAIIDRIYDLSYEFMDYPDDIIELGSRCYSALVDNDPMSGPNRPRPE